MKTLYDLLGALPDDDAEGIRAAFRKAVKATHPDRNPDNPEAQQRFRRIVRANAILSDERQRATYDELLEIALQQQGLKPKRGSFTDKARRAALDTMTGAALSVGLFGGGYLLLAPAPQVPLVRAPAVEVSKPKAALTALAPSIEPSDTVGRASSHDKPDEIAAPTQAKPEETRAEPEGTQAKPETPEATTSVTTSGTNAPSESADSSASSPTAPAAPDSGSNDPKYYHERGISAYRSGDLYLALVDFDLAISLDPNASDAYIDRAIVYHRMGDLKRAFADVSQARRIDDLNRGEASPPASVP